MSDVDWAGLLILRRHLNDEPRDLLIQVELNSSRSVAEWYRRWQFGLRAGALVVASEPLLDSGLTWMDFEVRQAVATHERRWRIAAFTPTVRHLQNPCFRSCGVNV